MVYNYRSGAVRLHTSVSSSSLPSHPLEPTVGAALLTSCMQPRPLWPPRDLTMRQHDAQAIPLPRMPRLPRAAAAALRRQTRHRRVGASPPRYVPPPRAALIALITARTPAARLRLRAHALEPSGLGGLAVVGALREALRAEQGQVGDAAAALHAVAFLVETSPYFFRLLANERFFRALWKLESECDGVYRDEVLRLIREWAVMLQALFPPRRGAESYMSADDVAAAFWIDKYRDLHRRIVFPEVDSGGPTASISASCICVGTRSLTKRLERSQRVESGSDDASNRRHHTHISLIDNPGVIANTTLRRSSTSTGVSRATDRTLLQPSGGTTPDNNLIGRIPLPRVHHGNNERSPSYTRAPSPTPIQSNARMVAILRRFDDAASASRPLRVDVASVARSRARSRLNQDDAQSVDVLEPGPLMPSGVRLAPDTSLTELLASSALPAARNQRIRDHIVGDRRNDSNDEDLFVGASDIVGDGLARGLSRERSSDDIGFSESAPRWREPSAPNSAYSNADQNSSARR
jgi:hypothetical protein